MSQPTPSTTISVPDRLAPENALLGDSTPPSDELHPSVTPGTRFKRYDSRVVEGLTLASCLIVALALLALAR
jgi:hypothetical protein